MSASKVLAKQLGKNTRVPVGTVVTFVSGEKYTYCAIYVNGQWYLSGNGYYWGKNVFTYDEFIRDVLSMADNIKVATQWDNLNDYKDGND